MASIDDIIKKREILFSLVPFSEEQKSLKRRTDLTDFTYSNLRLYGSRLSRDDVQNVHEGMTIEEAPFFEHMLCEAHRKLLAKFADKIEMGFEVDGVMLEEFCRVLSGREQLPYRKETPLLYHLDYIAGDADRIQSDLSELFAGLKRDDFDDFCLRAAALHNGIVKVYPYITLH